MVKEKDMLRFLICSVSLALWAACATPQEYDIVIRNGTLYDGSGSAPFQGDLAIQGGHHRCNRIAG